MKKYHPKVFDTDFHPMRRVFDNLVLESLTSYLKKESLYFSDQH
jgi:hypothetical protein